MSGSNLVEGVIECGPRTVTRVSGHATVYLGRDYDALIGRRVILIIKVLRTPKQGDSSP